VSRRVGVAAVSVALVVVFAPRRDAPALGDVEACRHYSGIPEGWPEDPDAGMVLVPGGRFTLGSPRGYREEWPGPSVTVGPFLVDRTEVTTAQFAAFVAATGYVTVAEREGGAPVFSTERWRHTAGAHWRSPDATRAPPPAEPVVQVAYEDAWAYARWLGHDLPTEAQWEFAARAGRDDDALERALRSEGGEWGANVWQGSFPEIDRAEDGFVGAAPVGCFAPNPFGLYDVVGNVWEWTRDPYLGGHGEASSEGDTTAAPRVIKGGSFLCSETACARFRVTARHPQETNMMTSHLGFRTIRTLR